MLSRWALVEPDFHECYGIDLEQPGILQDRSWRWLRVRLVGLLTTDSRIHRALAPPDKGRPEWRSRSAS